ncbi:MAG TPA: hypothetical protein VFA18_06065 [Gemmataceae bacterium]|nr:hypothetical protein [Gemmataceae bacterium]
MTQVKPDSVQTQRLLERARHGEPGAANELLARHRRFLRQIVGLGFDPRLRPRVDPSDVVQETQMEAFRRLDDYLKRRPMPFRLWLRKTAQERLLKVQQQHLRTSRRAIGREVPLPAQSSAILAKQLLQ